MTTTVVEIPVKVVWRGVTAGALANARAIFAEEMGAACNDIGVHVSERVKSIIRDKDIWSTGNLLNSITWSILVAIERPGVIVGTNLQYATYVETGTIPHFVPFHMAPSLYIQARDDWGWLEVDMRTREGKATKTAQPGTVSQSGGFKIATGRKTSYIINDTQLKWLKPTANSKPMWGVVVSGKAQPFMYPGWEQSFAYAEQRLREAAQSAAARISQGGT